MIEIKPLQDSTFGVEITGVDFSKPVPDDDMRHILHIFHEHGVILIRDQQMDISRFEWVAGQFGDHHPHFLDHLRLEAHPSVLMLSNIIENGRPVGVYEGAAFWHTDVAYEDPPNCATVVYGCEWSKTGCPTHFADMQQAYNTLPEKMKQQIDNLTVLHHYGNREDLNENSITSAEKLTGDQKDRVENVFHPLVKRHPYTGKKSLYGVAGSSFGIVGMPDDEAMALLDELKDHALQPQFVTSIDFKVGDVGAWDTYLTLHKATVLPVATGEDDRRLLWRISVNGGPPLLKNEVKDR